MKLLYHISTNLKHNGEFHPRIPDIRYHDENSSIPRIAVGTSIEKCLSSIPNGGVHLDALLESTYGFIKVFKIDVDKLNIRRKNIIDSDILYKNRLVGDAEYTEEHWILKSFTVPEEDQMIIQLTEWDEYNIDIIPNFIYKIAEKYYDHDVYQAYESIYKEEVPFSTEIKHIKYDNGKMKQGEEIELIYAWDYDVETIKKSIDINNLDIVIKEAGDSPIMLAKKDTNISPIIQYLIEMR